MFLSECVGTAATGQIFVKVYVGGLYIICWQWRLIKICWENPNFFKVRKKIWAIYMKICVCLYCWLQYKIFCRSVTMQRELIIDCICIVIDSYCCFSMAALYSFILLSVTCSLTLPKKYIVTFPWEQWLCECNTMLYAHCLAFCFWL